MIQSNILIPQVLQSHISGLLESWVRGSRRASPQQILKIEINAKLITKRKARPAGTTHLLCSKPILVDFSKLQPYVAEVLDKRLHTMLRFMAQDSGPRMVRICYFVIKRRAKISLEEAHIFMSNQGYKAVTLCELLALPILDELLQDVGVTSFRMHALKERDSEIRRVLVRNGSKRMWLSEGSKGMENNIVVGIRNEQAGPPVPIFHDTEDYIESL